MSSSSHQPDLPADVDEERNCILEDPSNSHGLSSTDPDSPLMWVTSKRAYASACAWFYVFTILYATTTYTALLPTIPNAFGVTHRMTILGFTNPFFGVFFAPILTPHLAEKYGRRPIYSASFALFSLCVLVIGLTKSFSILLAFRFLAGLFGGPCLVLIEGTFADVWSVERTVTYYSVLALASFLGAGAGPIVGNWILIAHDPQWISWITLLLCTLALCFGSGMPETYSRHILRARIHFTRTHTTIVCSPSGVTIKDMVSVTIFEPLKMLATEPIVLMITLYLGLNFGLVFQWFVTVPIALGSTYGFTGRQAGLAFFAALGGAMLALVLCLITDAKFATWGKKMLNHSELSMAPIEHRLVPAILGGALAAASLFWISFSVSPSISPYVPILGTGVYVWGNAMVLISLIAYLFDAYPAAGVLSALTAAACFRILCAGVLPLVIPDIISSLPRNWTFATFGVISTIFATFPIILYFRGRSMRARSKYNRMGKRSALQLELMTKRRDQTLAVEFEVARRALQEKFSPVIVPRSAWD